MPTYLDTNQNLADLSNKATARQNLGVKPGVDVAEFSASLDGISTIPANSAGKVTRVNRSQTELELQDPDFLLNFNGDFAIWERATSTTITGGGPPGYGGPFVADRFESWCGYPGNPTCIVSRQTFATGQTSVPGAPKYFYRHQQTVSAYEVSGAVNLPTMRYRFDDIRTLAGQRLVVKLWARCATGTVRISVQLRQNPGVGGTIAGSGAAVGTFSSSQPSIDTTWREYTFYIDVPNLDGNYYTSIDQKDSRATLDFLWGQNGETFTLDIAQLRTWAADAEGRLLRLPAIQEAACRRYAERRQFKTGEPVGTGYAITSGTAYFPIHYGRFRLGVTPAITVSDPSHYFIQRQGSGVFVSSLTSVAPLNIGLHCALLNVVKSGAFQQGEPLILFANSNQASILFDGEYSKST